VKERRGIREIEYDWRERKRKRGMNKKKKRDVLKRERKKYN
jgi:hypothetical protein